MDTLGSLDLDVSGVRSQGYNNGSSMNGKGKAVQNLASRWDARGPIKVFSHNYCVRDMWFFPLQRTASFASRKEKNIVSASQQQSRQTEKKFREEVVKKQDGTKV
jgi:hypothetical protein